MAGASDYMVGNAPGGVSYAAPLMDFSSIGNLGKDYQQGQQYQRTRALQTAFQDGLPRDQSGNIDIGAMADKLAKIGGADAAQSLIPQLINQQIGQGNANVISGNAPQPQQPGASAQPAPQQGVGAQPQPGPVAPPMQPSSNEATNPTTLANVVQSQIQDPAVAGRVMTALASKLGIDPGKPVDPNDPTVQAYIRSANGGVIPNGQTAGVPPQQQAQAAPQQPGGPSLGSASALVPPQYRSNPQGYVDAVAARATQVGQLNPKAAELMMQRIKPVMDAIAKDNELTPEGKNARDPAVLGFEAQKGMQASDIKHSEALFSGIQSLGNSSAGMADNVKLQKDLTNNPDFYSGPADKAALFLKRTVPSLAGSAAPMELYAKVLNANMLHMVDNMKAAAQEMGSSSSRIFTAQIQQIEKASGTLDNSPTGLRSLAELNDRSLKRNVQIADFATSYKQGKMQGLPPEFTQGGPPARPGMLDDNFEKGLRDWMSTHPVLTPQESADPRVLGAPTFKTPQEAHAAGLKKGDPVRTPDGRIVYAP
jgi:hypothetical protein